MSDLLFEINGLDYSYKDQKIFSGLDCKISKGDRILFLGANGSGKSSFLELLAGFKSIQIKASKKIKIAYVAHQPMIYADLSTKENLEFFLLLKQSTYNALDLMSDWGLDSARNTLARNLSFGEKRKISLALAFSSPSDLYLLDEPSVGLDLVSKEILMKQLNSLPKESTVLVSSHDIEKFSAWQNRALIINNYCFKEVQGDNLFSDYHSALT